VITLVLVPFQAGAEEVFNRGTLQQVLGGWGAPAWLAMLLTTGAFIAMHGTPNLGTIAIAAMGFTYAWLTLETGGLEAAIAGHAINNIVAFILGALAHGTDALDPQKLNERVDVTSLVVQLASIAIYTSLVLRSWRRSTRTAAV
jgi:membrane protease YdiL (CAAX protease family)